jgi:hypothetical protein
MEETYNPWTIVNVVFEHLADEGLHPVLGSAGHPGVPAAELLLALGIKPVAEGNARIVQEKNEQLEALRQAVFGDP